MVNEEQTVTVKIIEKPQEEYTATVEIIESKQ